jgi:hypothetical protein
VEGTEARPSGNGRRGWGTALALSIAVLSLSAVDPLTLIGLPLALLLLLAPPLRMRAALWGGGILALLLLVQGGGATPLGALAAGWALLLGAAFLAITVLRAELPFLTRALLAVAAALVTGGAVLFSTGSWDGTQHLVREHYLGAARTLSGALTTGRGQEFGEALVRMAEIQSLFFPALLALQSLAALALAWFVAGRIHPLAVDGGTLSRLSAFRFNDQLVWVVIAGLVLAMVPAGAVGLGRNLLLFMAGLYLLRGFAVFVFLLAGAPTMLTLLLVVMAVLLMYPMVLVAALLMGLGDTWFDVRARVAAARSA